MLIARVAIALAAFVAMWALGSAPGASGSAEIELLSLTTCSVLLAIAALAPVRAAELGFGAVAATVLALALPAGAGRGAAVMAVLAAALAIATVRRFRREGALLSPYAAVALLLGVQFLGRGSLLVDPGPGPRTLFILLGLPVLGAAVVAALAAVRGAPAWIAAAVLISAGGGLRGVWVVALGGLLALVLALRSPLEPRVRTAAWCGAAGAAVLLILARPAELWPLAAAGAALALPAALVAPAVVLAALLSLVSVIAAGYPWLRPQPAAVAVRLLDLDRPGRQVLPSEVLLDAASPRAVVTSAPARASRLLVRSALSDSAAVPAGAPAILVTVEAATGEQVELVLRAGHETGEWAARRPDLADLAAPTPWRSVAAGGFFAQEYRADFELPRSVDVVAVRLERAPTLPPEVRCVVKAIELR